MNIRIISGTYGGRQIEAPDGSQTHPMSERIRNALFNSLGQLVKDATVLDAFAGTGAVGLEALSRGAKKVTFVERDRIAQKVLARNIEVLGAADQANIIRSSLGSWLQKNDVQKYDIIFADPPYHDTQFSTVSELFALLKPSGYMILSHPGRGELPTKNGVVVVDNRSYGNAVLTFYRRDSAV
ncbi:MAG: 16S rRNA (guanine(966)-N(2))-methyltransferase RsmD [Candidatus Saccharimonadales bacterium]